MESTSFFENVFAVVRLIPSGHVSTYGAIARYLGSASSARMVGWAMNSSHNCPIYVPAHRVVNRNGMLSGRLHFCTPFEMEKLLKSEGIEVRDNQIIHFKRIFWDPSVELI